MRVSKNCNAQMFNVCESQWIRDISGHCNVMREVCERLSGCQDDMVGL